MPEVLRGSLGHVGLPSLLQLVESEATCGSLHLGTEARLGLNNGRVVAASYRGFEGRPALFEGFLFEDGQFVVEVGDPASGRPLGDTLEIVMTGCRLADEWRRVAPMHLGLRGQAPKALRPLVEHLEGRTVQAALGVAGLPRAVTVDPILHGLEHGQLREVAPPGVLVAEGPGPAPAPAPAPAVAVGGFHELLDAARQRLRDRQWDVAEALLHDALSLRPGDRVAAQNLARVRALRARQGAN